MLNQMLDQIHSPQACWIGEIALRAVLLELACTPKPGLVDRAHQGAHHDMDFQIMIRGASAIAGGFTSLAELGLRHRGPLAEALPRARAIGQAMEARMLRATGGVNTHRGAIFALGLTAVGAGRILAQGEGLKPMEICLTVAELAGGLVQRELYPLKDDGDRPDLSHGERVFVASGLTGARGEAAAGFPSVLEGGLPALRAALAGGLDLNGAGVHALLAVMAVLDDTCIVHRGSPEILSALIKPAARAALAVGGPQTEEGRARIADLDRELMRRGLSPGGAGDMLALTYALHFLEIEG